MLSSDFSNGLDTNVRSESVVGFFVPVVVGSPPQTPVIVVTPVTVISLVPTAVTLAKLKSLFPIPNFNILPTFTFAGNCEFELVMVLKPVLPSLDVTEPLPNKNSSLNLISPVKVLAKPTSPLF